MFDTANQTRGLTPVLTTVRSQTNSVIGRSIPNSGFASPTMTSLSCATSLMNSECGAIYEERLYQLQQAMT